MLGDPGGVHSWLPWRCEWNASAPGTYGLCCRAYDSTGNVQPVEQQWTARGMGNNMVHRLRVVVV